MDNPKLTYGVLDFPTLLIKKDVIACAFCKVKKLRTREFQKLC